MAAEGPHWIKCARVHLSFLAFLGFVNVYMLRVNLSVAMVAMVTPTPPDSDYSGECTLPGNSTTSASTTTPSTGATYDWDRATQGLILGSFFYGYIVTQLPGGMLAATYGGKWLFGLGVLCTAVFTLLTPLAAKLGVPVLVATRILEGLGEGVTFPAMHGMWTVWAPPLERTKLVSFSFAGAQFGTIIGLPLSGWITDALGWPYIFYIFGGIAVLWFILWIVLVSNTPATNRFITTEEKDYIESEMSKISDGEPVTFRNTPWISIAKSPAVWAAACTHFCHNWGFYTLLTCLPTYMKDVLRFDLQKDALISSLPYIFMWLFIPSTGYAIDVAREKQILSTTAARKLVTFIGFLVPAACLTAIGFVGCNTTLAVALLCICGAFDGVSQTGFNINHLDIAPKYASILMGVTNTIATIPGFLGPQVVGWLTTNNSTSEQWRSVFYISAEIYVFGIIIYMLLGSGAIQPWATSQVLYEPVSTEDTNGDCDLLSTMDQPALRDSNSVPA